MRVLVLGATGAIGRPLVERLRKDGHDVSAVVRDPPRAAWLRAAGVELHAADALDRASLDRAFAAARPEVVVNELTALGGIGAASSRAALARIYERNNEVRRVGYANVLAASRKAGVRRIVAQSSGFWYAPDGGDPVKDESARWWTDAPEPVGTAARTMLDAERALLADDQVEGVALRYGGFYGPGTDFARDGAYADAVRKRRLPILGKGDAVVTFVHVEDAADATARFVTRGEPGQAYNVAGDAARAADFVPEMARLLDAPKPMRVPEWVARLMVGPGAAAWLARQVGARSDKAAKAVGWRASRAWREGFSEVFGHAASDGRDARAAARS